ncbi:MAG: ABC transporter substrate-binding protein, partial [Reyranella sp.]|nr:ABC transporter substrate-binding protein [Reyranella sp.]
KPESGAITFFTTMHIAKGTGELDNAYKYLDLVVGKDAQEALTKAPYNFLPVNKDVPLTPEMPMKSLDEMANYVQHDWAKINPLRAAWIEKFNKEMAK